MNRVRLWILPAAVVVLLVVATFFLTVTEAGRGLVGLATGAASCDVLAPDTPVTGTLSAESVFDCYKFLADGTTYGADDITLRLISKSGKPFDADIYAPEKPVTAKNAGYKWITTKDTTEKTDTFTLNKDKGDYQVKVWSYAHDVGDYSFSFTLTEPLQPEKPTAENQKVESAACTVVTAGTAVTGTIDSSNKFDCYFFDAKADDQIVVSITSKEGTALDADLYAPGKQLTGGNA
ncbi:hypothetical protein M1N56_05965, partial [Dehalococcoidia bacterium]|nr:hypothetical protein [Dehalococcoidia bacterium]